MTAAAATALSVFAGQLASQVALQLFAESKDERAARASNLRSLNECIAKLEDNLKQRTEHPEKGSWLTPASEVREHLKGLHRERDVELAREAYQRRLDALMQPHSASEG